MQVWSPSSYLVLRGQVDQFVSVLVERRDHVKELEQQVQVQARHR